MCLVTYSKLSEYSSLNKLNKFNKLKNKNTPLWAHIEITDSCNHKCSWCYDSYHNKEKKYMSLNNLKIILDKMYDIGIIQITITGGEPLEHPQFEKIVEMISNYGFIFHLNTNGDLLDDDLLNYLKDNELKQISFNFQGSKWHDKIHKLESYERLKKIIVKTKEIGIETVAAIVIGGYNINDLDTIFKEADNLNVDRLRVWDVVNSHSFLNNIEIKGMFDISQNLAKKLGYNHTVSYDPLVNGDIQIKCIAGSGLYTHINIDGKMVWCPAYTNKEYIANWIEDSSEELIKKYIMYNKKIESSIDCLARK